MRYDKFAKRAFGTCLAVTLAFSSVAYADVTVPPIAVEGDNQNSEPGISTDGSNETIQKPVVQAEGAVLIDAATGKVLYGKNENTQYYPASITKIMTALITLESCSLSDVVTFSKTATTNLESGSVSLAITEGDQLTVEQSLYGLLLKSANEIGNGLAEHISGSNSAFAARMNQRAKELGCLNTNFANPHGLNDTDHKTTPYDMALIARAAFQNETFRKIDSTTSYEFPATKNAAARTITMGHKMLYPTDARYYEGIIGGKTGYTSKAGNTLVTGVERNGVRLIAVVMKSSSTHYTDTQAMLDYGFANYQSLVGQTSQTGQTKPAGPGEGAGTTGTTDTNQSGGEGGVISPQGNVNQWVQDSTGWYYLKADGTKAKNEWMTIDGNDYWFDGNEYMANGWRQFDNGAWYYFRSSGAMAKNYWVQTGDVWFYLGEDGVMLTNTTTPDGHWVNEVGIWVETE